MTTASPALPIFRGHAALEAHAAGLHDLARSSPAAHVVIMRHFRHSLTAWRRARRAR